MSSIINRGPHTACVYKTQIAYTQKQFSIKTISLQPQSTGRETLTTSQPKTHYMHKAMSSLSKGCCHFEAATILIGTLHATDKSEPLHHSSLSWRSTSRGVDGLIKSVCVRIVPQRWVLTSSPLHRRSVGGDKAGWDGWMRRAGGFKPAVMSELKQAGWQERRWGRGVCDTLWGGGGCSVTLTVLQAV